MSNLNNLSELIKTRNEVDFQISAIVQRPAIIGHVGEYIAAEVFGISLEESATNKSSDGFFKNGPLVDCTVNIKWYTKQTGILDITPDSLPDFYLVLTGEHGTATTSRGKHLPWIIKKVFLFNSQHLVSQLQSRNVKIGVATSVISSLWEEAEIFPNSQNRQLILSGEQRNKLGLFG